MNHIPLTVYEHGGTQRVHAHKWLWFTEPSTRRIKHKIHRDKIVNTYLVSNVVTLNISEASFKKIQKRCRMKKRQRVKVIWIFHVYLYESQRENDDVDLICHLRLFASLHLFANISPVVFGPAARHVVFVFVVVVALPVRLTWKPWTRMREIEKTNTKRH